MKYVILAGILIAVGLVVALQFIPIGIEPLTELYFENHTKLPKYIQPGREYNFTFTANNLEYRQMNYTYDVYAQYNNKTYQLNELNFTLENNETRSFYEWFALERKFDKAKIMVYLKKDTNETIDIDFWVEEIKGPTIIIVP
jgi:hypothetical protein